MHSSFSLVDNSYKFIKTSYKSTPWLINKHSISILPSINSLKIFRTLKNDEYFNNSLNTFVGIGNPKFNGIKKRIIAQK